MHSSEASGLTPWLPELTPRPLLCMLWGSRSITPMARKTQRQQFAEDLRETEDMIRAAKRQGHWHLLPALLQRHTTLFQFVNHRAIN